MIRYIYHIILNLFGTNCGSNIRTNNNPIQTLVTHFKVQFWIFYIIYLFFFNLMIFTNEYLFTYQIVYLFSKILFIYTIIIITLIFSCSFWFLILRWRNLPIYACMGVRVLCSNQNVWSWIPDRKSSRESYWF